MAFQCKNLHIHLDIVGGIAGDMFIAAILDTFEELQSEVLEAVAMVLPEEAGTAKLFQGLNSGISGLRFQLESLAAEKHTHHHEHSHHHTTYQYLCQLLRQSSLEAKVVEVAIDIFTIIAKAEAKIHSKTLEDVHFHELADWDSLMDVVASATILSTLSQCSWSISKLPLGGGLVQTQHGLIPVPAPATAEILMGFDFFDDGIQGERITPTGAAILRYLSDKALITQPQQGVLRATGYGLGTKVFPGMPNILRVMTFDKQKKTDEQQETVVLIEFDVDDMTAEELALSVDLIRAYQGVVDVVVQTARGKKNRAVELIRILANSEYYQTIIDYCFLQTTTIGLRYRFETRRYLNRELHDIDGDAYKSVTRPDGSQTIKIEHDQLASITTLQKRRMKKNKIESS
ncbi:LarC family nickel insertion protein [uncultured Paraglaciecola sp.]|uniref:LarC family nickel insertion protein n=1 Tax=uncultured Paraglaciecola sp. TaxID=1765024 RepID=UPI0030D7E00E|tara:strand:- start:67516 stop:68721 length:1206 start_codon:yes stop_codon:yes gene_type:complete